MAAQMATQSMSLMDILSPPGNPWLAELRRRKSDLPKGVRIVRFSEADDDTGAELDMIDGQSDPSESKPKRPKSGR